MGKPIDMVKRLRLFKRELSKYFYPAIIVLGVATVGTILLVQSYAANDAAVIEPENGSVSMPATGVSNATASGSGAVRFNPPSNGQPAQCANGGNFLWSNLAACGWPDASNTGYNAGQCPGGVLTVNSGSASRTIRVTTANSTVSCQNITGCLSIEASNVTVTNIKIACNSGKTGTNANGTSAIYVTNGASATISQAEINGMKGVHACIWHQGTSLNVTAVNCYGVNDGIFSWADTSYSQTTGDNFTIKDSYFHDFTILTSNGHIDGYQTEGSGNGLIDHNTFLMTSDDDNGSDSAVAIWNGYRSTHDIIVQNNLIAGGGFAIYAEDYVPSEANPAGGYSVTNVQFNNNKFSTHLFGCVGFYGVWYVRGAPTDGWRRSGNTVLETGANVDNGNPSYQGNTCN